MGKGTIMQKGVGGAKLYAAIGVTYPEDSTCTCSNGSKTFTAEDTSGEWVFAVPEDGKWTVTSTPEEGNGKSQVVEITAEGQFETVELSYATIVFGEGSPYSWTGTAGNGSGSYSATATALNVNRASGNGSKIMWAYVHTETAIDISKFSKLCFDISQISGSKIGIAVATTAGAGEKNQYAAYKEIASTGVVELDVSTLSGNYYIYLTAYREFTSSATSCTATRAWLE